MKEKELTIYGISLLFKKLDIKLSITSKSSNVKVNNKTTDIYCAVVEGYNDNKPVYRWYDWAEESVVAEKLRLVLEEIMNETYNNIR